MEPPAFTWYSYVLIFLILFASISTGIYFGCFHKNKRFNKDEYLLAGRNMGPFPVGISMISVWISCEFLVSMSSDVYLHGATILLEFFCLIITMLVTTFVFMPIFFKMKVTTIYEYLEMRFDRRIKRFVSFTYCMTCVLYLSLTIYAPSLVLSTVAGIRTNLAVLIVSFICIFYTSVGGLKAVVWTDNFQFTIVMITYLTVLVLGVGTAGGISNVWSKALESGRLNIFDFDPDPTRRDTFWVVMIGITLSCISLISIDQSTMQKLLSVPTYSDTVIALIVCCVGVCTIHYIFIFLGLTLYAKYGDCDPLSTKTIESNDQLLPLLVLEISQEFPGIASIFVIAAFTASLSSQSTFLNCLAGVICEDFVRPIFKISDRELGTAMKSTVVIIGTLSTSFIFVVEHLGNIFPLIIGLPGITIGPILGIFSLGFLFPKANAKGCLCGAITSLVALLAIAIPAAYYELQGLLKYPPKPLSTKGCVWTNQTIFIVDNTTTVSSTSEVPAIFRISFYYYIVIGTFLTILVGLVVSHIFEKGERPVDRSLISPIVCQKFLPRRKEGLESSGRLDATQRLTKVGVKSDDF